MTIREDPGGPTIEYPCRAMINGITHIDDHDGNWYWNIWFKTTRVYL